MDLLLGTTLFASFLGGVVALLAPCCVSVMLSAYFASTFQRRTPVMARSALHGQLSACELSDSFLAPNRGRLAPATQYARTPHTFDALLPRPRPSRNRTRRRPCAYSMHQ